ncbi:hypothetical protein GJ695_19430 [Pseudoduganella sp. FT9W]|uniref:hypothetical protein n=1 Tax=Duganella alba TaxID=2666081 RepID=UPI0012AF3C71|nr:hypothetical protein [Duganella alba]MRX18406.1 hypothetical protein [Duganella alba]
MNSLYSNRIEGQSTHPRNIERALQNDFSHRPDIARLQRIALAHIAAEKELEGLDDAGSALRSVFLIDAHRALYERLALGDRLSDDGDVIIPGQIRTRTARSDSATHSCFRAWASDTRGVCAADRPGRAQRKIAAVEAVGGWPAGE